MEGGVAIYSKNIVVVLGVPVDTFPALSKIFAPNVTVNESANPGNDSNSFSVTIARLVPKVTSASEIVSNCPISE